MDQAARVLIVDDDDVLRRLLRLNLSQAGYRVLEGLRTAYQEKPDLVILDIMMPGMDGWHVSQRLRDLSDVPIFMLAARGLPRDKVKGFRLGADDYLSKPVDMDELLLRVGAILRTGKSLTSTHGAGRPLGSSQEPGEDDAS